MVISKRKQVNYEGITQRVSKAHAYEKKDKVEVMLYFKEIPPINTKVYTEDQLKSQLTSSLRTISAFLNLAFQPIFYL